jgi:hypothetical protein
MGREIADEVEMRGKARVRQHAPGITTHREHLPALDEMVPVELERVRLLRHSTFIDDGLSVVLAGGLSSPSSLNKR